MSLANSGDYEGGLRIIDEQLSDKADESFVLDTKGYILFKQEKYQEASKVLEKASKNSPGDKYVWYHRGNVSSKLGQTGQALRCYRKAIEIDRRFAEAYNDEAAELSMAGRYQEASEALEKALKIKPDLVTVSRKPYPNLTARPNPSNLLGFLEQFKVQEDCKHNDHESIDFFDRLSFGQKLL